MRTTFVGGLKGKGTGKEVEWNVSTVKQTTTKPNTELVHRRNEALNFCWAQPFTETQVWPMCFHSCGLSWQPFSVHAFFCLVLEQSGHKKIFLSLQSPVSPCATFYPWGKIEVLARRTTNEQGSLVLLLSLSFELLFIIYVCRILNKHPLSFPAPVTECLWHSSLSRSLICSNLKTAACITVFRGHLFQTFMEG